MSTRTHVPRGQVGGECPRCRHRPLGMLEDAAPGVVPACTMKACGWVSPKLQTFLVLTRECNELRQALTDDPNVLAERAIIRTDDPNNAVRRCIRMGIINSRNRLISVQPLRKDAFIPVGVLDRQLTDEELQLVVEVNSEMQEAGISA